MHYGFFCLCKISRLIKCIPGASQTICVTYWSTFTTCALIDMSLMQQPSIITSCREKNFGNDQVVLVPLRSLSAVFSKCSQLAEVTRQVHINLGHLQDEI